MRGGVCARCGADLRGETGAELWRASEALVTAARRRQQLIDALPSAAPVVAPGVPAPTPVASPAPGPAPGPAPAPAPSYAPQAVSTAAAERPRSAVSLQSVLAVVGAGLLAVAAIVFTFLNPDLTDFATRTTIIAVVTAVFLGGAWLLHSRRLQFSAEAVGALGMVFLALDVWAFSRVAPPGTSGWFFGALALAVSGGAMVGVGAWLRMRTWLWSGFVGLALVPAFLGYGIEQQRLLDGAGWAATWGHVAVVFAGWGLLELARVLTRRMQSPLAADRVAITVVQLIAVLTAVPMTLAFTAFSDPHVSEFTAASVLAVLTMGALLTTRVIARALWSALAALLASGAFMAAAVAVPVPRGEWTLVLLAVAVVLPLGIIALVRRTGSVQRLALSVSALVMTAWIAVPSFFILAGMGVSTLARSWSVATSPEVDEGAMRLTLAATLALAVIALGVWALSLGTTHAGGRAALATTARWIAVPVAAGVPLVVPGGTWALIGCALAISVAASLALLLIPGIRTANLTVRGPLATIAYGAIVEAVLFSWPDAATAALAGAASVGALALAARTAGPPIRPLHTVIGFGYALVVGAAALSLTELTVLPILCLLTSAAAIVAIVASLTFWLPVGSWYAVLGVTGVPFAIGIVSVLIERSGWTALSTGVIFLLAATLLLTRRSGASLALRAGAASLLVPSLAVVVVCLAAQLLPVSGSPYALVVIAVLVACSLPTTGLVRAALIRYGLSEGTADAVRLGIESSALLTGAIAVVLSLVRDAAGLHIAFTVLLILGLGAAATALWMRRRYGWWTAGAAWTGALWCAWAMAGVAVVEPYVLPPALAATIVGAVLVARRRGDTARPAAALFATGLGVAVVPSLALLIVTGNGSGTSFDATAEPWRAFGLLAAGVMLTVLAGLVTRPVASTRTRFEPIRTTLLLGAVVAAAAGAVQGVRLGWGADPLPIVDAHPMLQAIAFALISTAIAIAVGRLAVVGGARSRWILAPAFVYLALGPMASIDDDPASIWMLWGVELLLLAIMVATAWHARTRPPVLPPVWFQWSLAWVVAVTAWSQREVLRVEGFALPLGLALVLAGALAFTRTPRDGDARTLSSWPIGFRGSWATLAPGIIATLLPSVMATFTDPQTWRAILVIAIALVAVLVGARKTLAAPFILGISTLPLEILIVFLVQLGDRINPLLWWITLATAGIVLLVIAVGWERRTGADASLAARIRDLR